MNKRNEFSEDWAIFQLGCLIALAREKENALPSSVISLVKKAHNVLMKRRGDSFNGKVARKSGNNPLVSWGERL